MTEKEAVEEVLDSLPEAPEEREPEEAQEQMDFSDMDEEFPPEDEEEAQSFETEDEDEGEPEGDEPEEDEPLDASAESEDDNETPFADLTREELLKLLLEGKPLPGTEEPVEESKGEDPSVAAKEAASQALSLLEEQYGLDQDAADKMLTAPEEVLPKLAAKLHLEITQSVANIVKMYVPQAIERQLSQRSERESYYRAVEAVNPQLAEYRDTVDRVTEMYRKIKPNLSQEQMAKGVADFVTRSLGVGKVEPQSTKTKAPPTKAVVKNVGQKGSRPKPPAAARARPGKAPGSRKTTNPFAMFAEEDLREDV